MIIGGSKKDVIKNIEQNIKTKELNKKVELNDPVLSDEQINNLISNFYSIRDRKFYFLIKSIPQKIITNYFLLKLNKQILIDGLENIKDIKGGAIITSNHFNPIDSLIIRKAMNKISKKMQIVIQDTNLALPKKLGYLMNYSDVIPISKSPSYIIETFKPNIKKMLDENNFILIYPEEEMWFNYRKPRPLKRGAYMFAAEFDVPIISCFTEIIDTKVDDNDEFYQVKYILHILEPIYKNKDKSNRENSIYMAKKDYEQKCQAYEKYYNKKLEYDFSFEDIAGYKKKDD